MSVTGRFAPEAVVRQSTTLILTQHGARSHTQLVLWQFA